MEAKLEQGVEGHKCADTQRVQGKGCGSCQHGSVRSHSGAGASGQRTYTLPMCIDVFTGILKSRARAARGGLTWCVPGIL